MRRVASRRTKLVRLVDGPLRLLLRRVGQDDPACGDLFGVQYTDDHAVVEGTDLDFRLLQS